MDSVELRAASAYRKVALVATVPFGKKLIEKLSLKEGDKVLDLGCGTGELSHRLAELVGPSGKVVGVDPDKERLQLAREAYKLPRLSFFDGDDTNFPEDKYDLVFSNLVLHWIKDKEPLFRKVSENLRPGGQFAFTVTIHFIPIIKELLNLNGVKDRADSGLGELYYVQAQEYEDMALANGLQLLSKDVEEINVTVPDVDEIVTTAFGVFHGRFDPKLVDAAEMEKFKQPYLGGPVDRQNLLYSFIFTK